MLTCSSLTQVGCGTDSAQHGPMFAPRTAETSILLQHWSALLQQFDRGIPLWFIAFEGVIALALSWPL